MTKARRRTLPTTCAPMPDRHLEKPLSLRLGAERQRLEDYARDHDQPIRSVIKDAVKALLDNAENHEGSDT